MSPARIVTPAFACLCLDGNQPGMSQRQFYKSAALSILANEDAISEIQIAARNEGRSYPEYLADICGNIADAMIAEDAK